MVSNLGTLPGIVSMKTNYKDRELITIFNGDTVTKEDIIARITRTGDKVTDWKIR